MAQQWQGKLIDAAGPVGTVTISLPERDDRQNRAAWSLQLAERDVASELKGEFEVGDQQRDRKDGLTLRSKSELPDGGSVEWSMELTRAEAGQYAEAAMVGQYRVASDVPIVPLSQGVLVLWRFA
jgi:hypothetical protein